MKKNRTSKIFAMTVVLVCMMVMFTGCSNNEATTSTGLGMSPDNPVVIIIDEWIGYQNAVDANGGLTTAPDSINAKHGIYVKYVVMNDSNESSNALINGQAVGSGYTVNRFAFLQDKFDKAGVSVVMPIITNYSNGCDGIIAKSDILSVEGLVGRKIGGPR